MAVLAVNPAAKSQTTASSGAIALTFGTDPLLVTTPLLINSSGTYYLTQDVIAATPDINAVSISANNVTFDLNGHTISTPVSGSVELNGVYNSGIYAANCSNVSIRNGKISGFYCGILFASTVNGSGSNDNDVCANHFVEDVIIGHCTLTGIYLQGGGSIVRRCQISGTGGTAIQIPDGSNGLLRNQPDSYGMVIFGPNNRVIDCDITGVNGNVTDAFSRGRCIGYGIYFSANATNSFAFKNRIGGVDHAIFFTPTASGKYGNNITTTKGAVANVGGTDLSGTLVDVNNNRINDSWETLYFGSQPFAAGDDPDNDGYTNLEEYLQGSNPMRFSPLYSIPGLTMHLAWEKNVTPDGSIQQWSDRSGSNHNAVQNDANHCPTLINNVINGYPVANFVETNAQSLGFSSSPFTGAASGEILLVLRSNAGTGHFNGLNKFGTASGDYYPTNNGTLVSTFGTNVQRNEGVPSADVTQFNIYDRSSSNTLWQSFLNGVPLCSYVLSASEGVAFESSPELGTSGGSFPFTGDIAEVITYARTLSSDERKTVHSYLAQKYALAVSPAMPSSLSASKMSPTQNLLTWAAPFNSVPVDYIISRATSANGVYATIAIVSNTGTYVDISALIGQAYYYRIYAQNSFGKSVPTVPTAVTDVHDNGPATPIANGPAVAVDGLRLWLMGDGTWTSRLSNWHDYSGWGNDAYQYGDANRPTVIASQLNGKPVIRFESTSSQSLSLPNIFRVGLPSPALSGEIILVLKGGIAIPVPPASVNSNALGLFGGQADWYPIGNGNLLGSFGSNVTSGYNQGLASAKIATQFNIYDMASQPNLWQSWLNGLLLYQAPGNTVAFNSLPTLGYGTGSYYFTGDIAEVLVYSRTLTNGERLGVNTYLASKYLIPDMDPDFDGLTTAQEQDTNLHILTDPLNPDTNGDGVLDGIEYYSGFDPKSMDEDGDTISNADEIIKGTNPFAKDTDQDGVPDNLDYYPLDRTRSTAPGQTTGAPILTLTFPPYATFN